MVFGSRRDQKSDALSREDVVGNLYPDNLSSEVDVTPQPEMRREERGNESVIDPHARFNGKYVSDRDLRIEGEAQGEIECQGTLIISPQARVRSAIQAHNVIINGDYEGDVDCGGRFEIGSTGRVKGVVKTQVLVVKEGAHWEGSVTMTRDAAAPRQQGGGASQPQRQGGGQSASGQPASGQPASGQGAQSSIFSKQDREAADSERQPTRTSGNQ
jgi:cytoskeletal protein CcmA (bactofilin family)